MRRVVLLCLVCSVPALMLLNAWQVFRFQAELSDVQELESQQRDLIEENKKALIGVEILSSPARIEGVVEELEGVSQHPEVPRLIIRVGEVSGGS